MYIKLDQGQGPGVQRLKFFGHLSKLWGTKINIFLVIYLNPGVQRLTYLIGHVNKSRSVFKPWGTKINLSTMGKL